MLSRRGLLGLLPAGLLLPLMGKNEKKPKPARIVLHEGGRLKNATIDGGITIAGSDVQVFNCRFELVTPA